jgi:hypothetical protein
MKNQAVSSFWAAKKLENKLTDKKREDIEKMFDDVI